MEDKYVWPWTLGDRLRKALELGHVTREEMAEELGVSAPTVSRYLNGTTPPKRRDLKLWAQKTGVPLAALELQPSDTGPGLPDAQDRCIARPLVAA